LADYLQRRGISPNSGHTVTVLRIFAQIRQSRTSYVRKQLGVMADLIVGGTEK